jgi:3-phosphoshikimate 1-carboxyvinyltransferase
MRYFGIDATWEDEHTLIVKEGSGYIAKDAEVEGDYSAAVFPDALAAIGADVSVLGLRADSLQGDKVYKSHLKALTEGYAEISLSDCPDLGPILFTVAAACHGARFTDTARLKIKESDRAVVMAEELKKFGADIEVFENSVEVGCSPLHTPTSTLCGHNDHRVVMSLAVLATKYGGEISGAEAVKKSYPEFFAHLKELNINLEIYD